MKAQLEQVKAYLEQTKIFDYFEIQRSYQNEPKFNGIYSRNNLSNIKDGGVYNKS